MEFLRRFRPCPVCGARRFRPDGEIEWSGRRFKYDLCAACGLKAMRRPPTDADYEAFYRDEFWGEGVKGKPATQEVRTGRAIAKARYHRDFIVAHCALSPSSRMLDIGCGYGFAGKLVREATGCATDGVEPGSVAAEIARENGVDIVAPTVEALPTGESYDVVSFASSLINLSDPVAGLRIARGAMAEDGRLYVQINNPVYRGGESFFHPVIMARETLDYALRKAGYEPLIWDADGDPDVTERPFRWWLTVVARKSSAPPPQRPDFDVRRFRASRKLGQKNLSQTYKDKEFLQQMRETYPII